MQRRDGRTQARAQVLSHRGAVILPSVGCHMGSNNPYESVKCHKSTNNCDSSVGSHKGTRGPLLIIRSGLAALGCRCRLADGFRHGGHDGVHVHKCGKDGIQALLGVAGGRRPGAQVWAKVWGTIACSSSRGVWGRVLCDEGAGSIRSLVTGCVPCTLVAPDAMCYHCDYFLAPLLLSTYQQPRLTSGLPGRLGLGRTCRAARHSRQHKP